MKGTTKDAGDEGEEEAMSGLAGEGERRGKSGEKGMDKVVRSLHWKNKNLAGFSQRSQQGKEMPCQSSVCDSAEEPMIEAEL